MIVFHSVYVGHRYFKKPNIYTVGTLLPRVYKYIYKPLAAPQACIYVVCYLTSTLTLRTPSSNMISLISSVSISEQLKLTLSCFSGLLLLLPLLLVVVLLGLLLVLLLLLHLLLLQLLLDTAEEEENFDNHLLLLCMYNSTKVKI